MTREELKPALAECEGHNQLGWFVVERTAYPQTYSVAFQCETKGNFLATHFICHMADGARDAEANARLVALAPALASALREAWAEIDRLKAERPNYGGWIEYLGVGSYKLHIEPPVNPSLDAALNEGDGSYKP
jgi:thiaminase